jgi:predicted patatin/cPLA2 family phospholipase
MNTSATRDTALIVEGGSMRSIFSAGVLDGFLARQFNPFDFYIGVSGGALNLVTYLNESHGKGLQLFQKLALDKNFINYARFFRGGHLIDLDWLVASLFSGEHIQLDTFYRSTRPLIVCVTSVTTGEPTYIEASPRNIQSLMKASCSLPLLYRGFPEVDNQAMTDGGVGDGIPVARAIQLGAKRIMVIRSRDKHYMKRDTLGHRYIRWKMRTRPALLASLKRRIEIYRDSIAVLRKPPDGVQIVEICPPEDFNLGRFSLDQQRLQKGYETGFAAAHIAIAQWIAPPDTI